VDPRFVYRDDSGVLEACSDPSFLEESRLGVTPVAQEHLDRNGAAQSVIVNAKNLAQSPAALLGQDGVVLAACR
jgi:hypothetical protein